MKTVPDYHGKQITLGDVMETGQVEEQYFIPEEKLFGCERKTGIFKGSSAGAEYQAAVEFCIFTCKDLRRVGQFGIKRCISDYFEIK